MSNRRCYFCQRGYDEVEYTQTSVLSKFVTGWAKIKSGSDTRLCARHQRALAGALKRARFMALMPYVKR